MDSTASHVQHWLPPLQHKTTFRARAGASSINIHAPMHGRLALGKDANEAGQPCITLSLECQSSTPTCCVNCPRASGSVFFFFLAPSMASAGGRDGHTILSIPKTVSDSPTMEPLRCFAIGLAS